MCRVMVMLMVMVMPRLSAMARLRLNAMMMLRWAFGSAYRAGDSHDGGHALCGGGSLELRKQQLSQQKMTCRLYWKPIRFRHWDRETIAAEHFG